MRLFLEVLRAVQYAHSNLILHRDLKPANILGHAQGRVKLLDFGIAKLLDDRTQGAQPTELTQLAGRAFTPEYAAPEQIQGEDVTTATDVYALGVLLYQLLSGEHPTALPTVRRSSSCAQWSKTCRHACRSRGAHDASLGGAACAHGDAAGARRCAATSTTSRRKR